MLIGGKGTGDIRSGEERAAFTVDYTINPDVKAKPVKEDGMKDEIAEGSGYTFAKGENEKYVFVLTDSEGNEHKTETDEMPATIEDKDGNTYEVDEEGNLSPASNASTAVVSKLPLYVGVARNEGQQLPSAFYTCNFNNIDRFEEIHEKVKQKIKEQYPLYGQEASCEIMVDDRITSVDRYNVRENASTKEIEVTRYYIDNDDKFYTYLNGEETEFPIMKEQLKSGINICRLVVKNATRKTEKTVAEFSLIPEEENYPVMEVRRSIQGNPNRKDVYRSWANIPQNKEQLIYPNDVIYFNVKEVTEKPDTVQASNGKTRWYIDGEETARYTGAEFRYTVPGRGETVTAVSERTEKTDTVTITINPTIPVINGNIRPDYWAVKSNPQDTIDSRRYFNVAVAKCMTSKVGEFIKAAPKEIVVKTYREAANSNGKITQGEVDAGADVKKDAYNYLEIMINAGTDVDADGAIRNTVKLVSKLNFDNIDLLKTSIKQGKANQKAEGILAKIERLSADNANQIRQMIIKKDTTQFNLLDSVYYEIKEGDPLEEWVTFHSGSTIDVRINLTELGNTDPKTPTPQTDFTRLLAHELLHHWWTHFKPFNKLKWMLIQEKESEIVSKGYRISDGSIPGSDPKQKSSDARDANHGCSMGSGHERNNPENRDVCDGQYNY